MKIKTEKTGNTKLRKSEKNEQDSTENTKYKKKCFYIRRTAGPPTNTRLLLL